MFEIKICLPRDYVDDLSDQLLLFDAVAITLQAQGIQPIYEPKPGEILIWNDVTLVALFASKNDASVAEIFLQQKQQQGIITSYITTVVADVDWVKESLKQFQPTQFGKRLWICPSWEAPPCPEHVTVLLDPGLAFGTGTHPTTALCLEWLDQQIVSGETILDFGCGSGILALAALKLGSAHAFAVDYDPQALEACQNNAELNAISDTQLQICLPENLPQLSVDVCIANILAKPLIAYADFFAMSVKPKGKIILSGILIEQASDVIKAYEQYFQIHSPIQKDEWVLIAGEKF